MLINKVAIYLQILFIICKFDAYNSTSIMKNSFYNSVLHIASLGKKITSKIARTILLRFFLPREASIYRYEL